MSRITSVGAPHFPHTSISAGTPSHRSHYHCPWHTEHKGEDTRGHIPASQTRAEQVRAEHLLNRLALASLVLIVRLHRTREMPDFTSVSKGARLLSWNLIDVNSAILEPPGNE